MKAQYLFIYLIFSLFIGSSINIHATHVAGGEIQYRYIGDSTNTPRQYLVIVKLYRLQTAPVQLPAAVNLCISSSCFANSTVNLPKIPPAQLGFTPLPNGGFNTPNQDECTGSGPGTGFTQIETHWYQGVVTLPQNCSDVRFSYVVICCRNPTVNIMNAGFQTIYLEARLNSLLGNNTSPQFLTPAARSFCTNSSFTWSQATFEPDNDSVLYKFGTPQGGNNNCGPGMNLNWQGGFNPTTPFPIAPGTQINISNAGTFSFTTGTQTGNFVLRVDVEEYRYDTIFQQWMLVGTAMRDMQVNFTGSCLPTVQKGPRINTNLPGFSQNKESTDGTGPFHSLMNYFGYPINNDSVPDLTSPTFWSKNIPIVEYNCFDTIVTLKFDVGVQCATLSPNGSEFRIVGPDTILRPVVSIVDNCGPIGESNEIQLKLFKPLTVNGDYLLYVKEGDDGNTFLNSCGFPIPEFYTMVLRVQNCPNPVYDIENVSVNKNMTPFLEWVYDPATVNTNFIDGWKIFRSDDDRVTFNEIGFSPGINTTYFDFEKNELDVNAQTFQYEIQLVMAETFYKTRSITSILLDSFPGANDFEINLFWNHYDGWPNPEYKLYVGEYDAPNDSMIFEELIDNNLPTTDTNYRFRLPCDPDEEEAIFYWVKVEAFDPTGNKPYLSHSNYVLTKCPGNPVIPPDPEDPPLPIEVPNVFTPNNDGMNDLFEIKNIEMHRNARLVIKDRWGGTVFKANNYESSNPWNGSNMNTGSKVADGTYFYILQYFDTLAEEEKVLNGTINVFGN